MDSELPFGYARREKRSAAHMDLDGSASPTCPFDRFPPAADNTAIRFPDTDNEHTQRRYSNDATHTRLRYSPSASHPEALFSNNASNPSLHLPRPAEMPSEPPRRFQGDGYDYRRPVTSSSNIIDLTSEDALPSAPSQTQPQAQHPRPARPPRFGREIIDIDASDPPGSPEIQFVSSRRISPPERRNPTPYLELDDEDEDEVEFLRANPLPEAERRQTRIADLLSDPVFRARAPHLRGSLERHEEGETRRMREAQIARMERLFAASRSRRTPRPLSGGARPIVRIGAPRRGGGATIHVGFLAPNMDFGAVGFNLGFADEGEAVPAPPPPPTYEAPGAAPEGFTRSPKEEEVLVCPNCGEELCVGESERKRQVWLVKGCGHVYCGECMANRHITKKGKEKATPTRTKPFKECVVEGCPKKVSSKNAVIQIFL